MPVADFATDEVLDLWAARANSTCLGFSPAAAWRRAAPRRFTGQMPNMVWLYRRPILDYWAEGEDTLGDVITPMCWCMRSATISASRTPMAAIEAAAD